MYDGPGWTHLALSLVAIGVGLYALNAAARRLVRALRRPRRPR